MPRSVSYDAEAGLVLIRIEGRVDMSVIRAALPQVLRVAAEHDCFRVLSDLREADLMISTVELYDLPQTIADAMSKAGVKVQKYRRAIVIARNLEDFAFFETVARNRGHVLRTFHDVDAAKNWLIKGTGRIPRN